MWYSIREHAKSSKQVGERTTVGQSSYDSEVSINCHSSIPRMTQSKS